jgi:hypothetical protein
MTKAFLPVLVTLAFAASSVGASGRFVAKLSLPSGQTVVVSEGEFEARSIGSYSVRLYRSAAPENETTFFISGLVSARDGVVEKVMLVDINGDELAEIVVVVRSVGTGSYLSAHAFSVDMNQRLILLASIEGLQSTADPVAALRETILPAIVE